MSIKLTAKEVTDRVASNKNCIISYYPHPHSPPEKSELKRLVKRRIERVRASFWFGFHKAQKNHTPNGMRFLSV